jgi:hypothetical protein
MIERHPVSVPLNAIGWPAWIGFALAGPVGGILATVVAAVIFVLYALGRL